MKNGWFRKIAALIMRLCWDERAQIAETLNLFAILLFSVGSLVTSFGVLYYLLQHVQGTPCSLVECLYFVWITFATIGYSDEGFTGSALIRVVTILVGAFLLTRYIVLSAHIYARFIVDEVFNRKQVERMKKRLRRSSGHLLIFGDDPELIHKIIQGLSESHDFFLVSDDRKLVTAFCERYDDLNYIPEKPFSAGTVDRLRPEAAAGAYTLFRDDEKNILLAAMLENRTRVISAFSGNQAILPRFHRIGVEPIAPHAMSGLKIVSTLIRPQVTEFLDRYIFPDDSPLEFRVLAPEEPLRGLPLAAVQAGGEMDFSRREANGHGSLVLTWRGDPPQDNLIGPLEAPSLPCRTNRFLVFGGGTIGRAVLQELLATRRELTLVEPEAAKIEQLRHQYGEEHIRWVVGSGSPEDYRVEDFDGAAIVTPVDEINFAIGLDFVDAPLHRVVRAVDDDMDHHYRRIGAVPVFVGKVGAARMLREVTNRRSNEVLGRMLRQQYRLDEVYLARPAGLAQIEAEFGVRVLAVCRAGRCHLVTGQDELFLAADTLIVCGQVADNQRLRLANRVAEEN